MRIVRHVALGSAVAVMLVPAVFGQQQRPGANSDLLTEVRGLRADLNRASTASLQTQVVAARLTIHDVRMTVLSQQLTGVRQQRAENRMALAAFADQMKLVQQDPTNQMLAPLRNTLEQVQRRDAVLDTQEADLTRQIADEQDRLTELSGRLTEIEGSLPPR